MEICKYLYYIMVSYHSVKNYATLQNKLRILLFHFVTGKYINFIKIIKERLNNTLKKAF